MTTTMTLAEALAVYKYFEWKGLETDADKEANCLAFRTIEQSAKEILKHFQQGGGCDEKYICIHF